MFDDFGDENMEAPDPYDDDNFGSFAPPEPDEPEGLLPPREAVRCLGHENVEQTLLSLINSGAMPHALIFSGQKGIGKSTMAYRLTRYLLKHGTPDTAQDSMFDDAPTEAKSLDVAADDPTFSKVVSGGHPDLLTIERPMDAKKGTRKNNVDVETARKVAPFLRMTASNGGWRVVVIDDADTMNRNAQNAMLKILEEPPKNAILILITHRLGAMIPTIRSRCRVLNFDPLPDDILANLMEKEVGGSLSSEQRTLLNNMSGGSIGVARKIIESNGLETTETIIELFKKWPDFNWVDIHHLSDQAGRAGQNDNFPNIEKSFLWVVENFIFTLANPTQQLPNAIAGQEFQRIRQSKNVQEWLDILEALKAHFNQFNYQNLDKRQGVLGAFSLLK